MRALRVLLVGGGTAGHIAPLVAVLEELDRQAQQQSRSVVYAYAGRASDFQSPVLKTTIPFQHFEITSGKLNRYLTLKHAGELRKFIQGMRQARQVVRRFQPDVVFAKGGAMSVPVVLAAARLGIPVYTHETDVVPGLANRWLARFATTIFTAFPVTAYRALPQGKLREVGQPVRAAFRSAAPNQAVSPALPLVTVIGGSQGSLRLNELFAALWPHLLEKVSLVQITGPTHYEHFQELASTLPPAQRENLSLSPFVAEELPALFAKSTLVVSRAGGTIAELAASHAASLLIPLPTAAQNHQQANAEALAQAGAARVVAEKDLTPEKLLAILVDLLDHPETLQKLRTAIATFDHPEAATQIAQTLLQAPLRPLTAVS